MRNLTGLGRNQLIDHIVALENRMSVYEDVMEFWLKGGAPDETQNPETADIAVRLVVELCDNFRGACSQSEGPEGQDPLRMARKAADLIYAITLFSLHYGLPLREAWDESHQDTMRNFSSGTIEWVAYEYNGTRYLCSGTPTER